MPIQQHFFQLQFDQPINVSVQVGDEIYFTTPTGSSVTGAGTSFALNQSIQFAGTVHIVYESSIVVVFNCDDSQFGLPNNPCLDNVPDQGDFIMFAKNGVVNTSSILGYYAEVKMVNNSNEKAKLFAVSTDISESSK